MHTQRLCVTVTAPSTAELRRRRDAVRNADLIELRLDSVADPDAAGALADRSRPVIVTCRPVWEGGAFAGSEEERQRILAQALAGGADYVDVEARAGFDRLIGAEGGRRIVLSAHDFQGMPDDLDGRIRGLLATPAAVVKIAATTSRLTDAVALRDASSRAGAQGRLIVIGMGDHGLVSRVLPSCFGSPWSYAGSLSGIGQVTPDSLVNGFRFTEIDRSTMLYGVVGSPVGHSVSPAMHNAAFRACGVNAVYLPLPAADVDDAIAFARAFQLAGASVTVPYKVAIRERLDETSALAAKVGAVNTIRRDGARWLGENSDVPGFLEPLRTEGPLAGTRIAILGAGGAARAVAVAVASSSAHVTIHARNQSRAGDVAALAGGAIGPWPPEAGTWDLLVNTTPIGMHPQVGETPVPAVDLTGRLVYDLVYNPGVTRLLQEAARAGCRTIGGLDMLIAQARAQFEWWTGIRPPEAVMRDAAVSRLVEFSAARGRNENIGVEVHER
jgi:3-dehydroquinate dehydratase/shikimate dehydrogenase